MSERKKLQSIYVEYFIEILIILLDSYIHALLLVLGAFCH